MKKNRALPVPIAFVLEVAEGFLRAGAPRAAAALSYYLILTLFPLLMCANYFIGLFRLDLEQFLLSLDQFLPAGALAVMGDYLDYAAASQSPALLWASLVTILISASAGLRTLLEAMDALYGVTGGHPVGRMVLSVALSVLALLTVYLSVAVIFTGEWFFRFLEEHLPAAVVRLIPLPALSELWRWMRYLLLFCFVLILVLAVYRVGTPRGAPAPVLPAALAAALSIVAASALFSWFIGMSSRYTLVYGSLASLIILLVWLYFCGNILLLGAVVCQTAGARRAARKEHGSC